jgi:hypothetical protein
MQFLVRSEATVEGKHHCSKCEKVFDEPELVSYRACPHCHTKIEEEQRTDCQYWFGYLNQKEKNESIPHECVECQTAVECMLNQQYNSPTAVAGIKKWYSP